MNDPDRFETLNARNDLLVQGGVHQQPVGLYGRFSRWRDEQVARKALDLAGQPGLVLDVPCSDGRFWPLLAEKSNRIIIAADSSTERVQAACRLQPIHVVRQVRPIVTSVFDLELPDNAVDSIFCMRLMHLIGDAALRRNVLKEFQRVTRDTLVISLWVDGNFKARRRLETQRHQAPDRHHQRFVIPRQMIEDEFAQAGFQVHHYIDVIPFYAMWRVYILRKV
ncbi:MAG: SAM-dependent methyltransferase [Pseudomonas sp.]|nr:SAM-dependent methyltransferase [Pseudomonas sp.]